MEIIPFNFSLQDPENIMVDVTEREIHSAPVSLMQLRCGKGKVQTSTGVFF